MLVAHFSDMHVTKDGETAFDGVDTSNAFARCIEHVNNLDPSPDIALITGDLTLDGGIEEYATLRAHLSILDPPYYLIPGNHDDRANLRSAFADFHYMNSSPKFVHYSIDDYEVRLVGIDTLDPGKENGILCQERLEWLNNTLSNNTLKPTIIFMHHPPFKTAIKHMDNIGLHNDNQFLDVISFHKQIRMILCGHVHRPIQTELNGVPTLTAPGTAHQMSLELRPDQKMKRIMEPPALYLHLIDGNQRITHTSYIGDYSNNSPFHLGFL